MMMSRRRMRWTVMIIWNILITEDANDNMILEFSRD
jgi:hypothetical protein